MVFGEEPEKMKSMASLGPTRTDDQSVYIFRYDSGAMATLSSSFKAETPKVAHISGTKGSIHLPLFWKGQEAILQLHGKEAEHFNIPYEASGLQFQASAMMEDIRKGFRESPIMPLEESLQITKMMDRMRGEWGLVYPGES